MMSSGNKDNHTSGWYSQQTATNRKTKNKCMAVKTCIRQSQRMLQWQERAW